MANNKQSKKTNKTIASILAGGMLIGGMASSASAGNVELEYSQEKSLQDRYGLTGFEISKYLEGKAGIVNGEFVPFYDYDTEIMPNIDTKYIWEGSEKIHLGSEWAPIEEGFFDGVRIHRPDRYNVNLDDLTQREILGLLFSGTIESFKSGYDIERTYDEIIQTDFDKMIYTKLGYTTDRSKNRFLHSVRDNMEGMIEGSNPYLIKKIYSWDSMRYKVKNSIDKDDRYDYDIITMVATNKSKIGYKKENQGVEYYLIRADSVEKAKEKSMHIKSHFNITYDNWDAVSSIKEFDKVIMELMDEPEGFKDTIDDMMRVF